MLDVRHRSPAPARAPSEPPSADDAPERTSAARNPWLWATAAVAVVAIALGVWALNERSNANDAKSDLQAQEKQAARRRRTETQRDTAGDAASARDRRRATTRA